MDAFEMYESYDDPPLSNPMVIVAILVVPVITNLVKKDHNYHCISHKSASSGFVSVGKFLPEAGPVRDVGKLN